MIRGKLVLALAAVIVGALSCGCALKLEARLLAPINRETKGADEDAQTARARLLLAGGLSAGDVVGILRAQGQTEDEARRIVALAIVPKK